MVCKNYWVCVECKDAQVWVTLGGQLDQRCPGCQVGVPFCGGVVDSPL